MSTKTSPRRQARWTNPLVHRAPVSPQDTCENLIALDRRLGTAPSSPMHHDQTCPLHSHILSSPRHAYGHRNG
jgi:hypothetical protein